MLYVVAMKRFIDNSNAWILNDLWANVKNVRRKTMRPLWGLALLCFWSLSSTANAQTYPNRPVKIIVPYAAGGTADTLARKIGQHLTNYLAQPIIVNNRAGGGGIIGGAALAQSSPDGYVIGMLATPHVATPVDTNSNFDTSRVKPVSLVAIVPSLVWANPLVPATSVPGVISVATPADLATSTRDGHPACPSVFTAFQERLPCNPASRGSACLARACSE
jgi:hypothetical protein